MKQLWVLLLLTTCYFLLTTSSLAQEMGSQNFQIQGGNFNMTSGHKSSQNFKLEDVVGQTASITFASKGYIIQSGFLNAAAGVTFLFTVTPPIVDFGNLLPDTPVEREIRIKIANGDVPGYTVSATENQPLSTSVGAEIPDTSCDGGQTGACILSQGAAWTQNTSYGFGYRMNGRTVPSDFVTDSFYRPFPASIRGETPTTIMATEAKKVTDEAIMRVKVNIDRNQPVGQYRNVISFTALAGI